MSAGGSSRTASVSSRRYRCERRLQPAAATSTNDATAAAAAAGLRAVPAAVTAVADVAVVGNATALGQLFVGQTRCGTRRLWPLSPAAIIIIIAAAAQSSPSSSAGWSGDRRFATLPVGRWFGLRSRRIHVGSTRIETRPGNQTHSIPFHHHLLFFSFFFFLLLFFETCVVGRQNLYFYRFFHSKRFCVNLITRSIGYADWIWWFFFYPSFFPMSFECLNEKKDKR